MSDAGFHNFPITLNPTAKEFRPTFLPPPNPNYYTFLLPPPPPPQPPSAYFLLPPPPALPPPSTVPTRALLLSSVPTHISESTLRRELEVFGDVRAVQMERLRDGIVTVHFYDIRQAVEAMTEIKEQHMKQQYRLRKYYEDGFIFNNYYNNYVPPVPLAPPARGIISGRAVWAQFTFPVTGGFPDGYNQGNVVVFNLGSDVSSAVIREIFEAFGCVKEIRDTPLKKNQKFVEFYDTRDAAKAVAAVNGREIGGKPVVAEFSRPGSHKFNYKHNKIMPISTGDVQPPPVTPYRPQPPCRKDRVVDYGGGREVIKVSSPRGGLKKNGKNFYKHQQPLEREAKWLSGGDCDGNGGRNKPWKVSKYTREKCDVRFLIKEDDVISSVRDSRTTVMIKNIPNKYSQKLLLNMLDNHCIQCNEQLEDGEDDQPLSSYDFVYLPIDFVNKCNVGYGFVNMTSPEATWRLYKAFHNKNWEVFNSKKICEVSYARLQGVEALKEHFKSSKFPREAEEYMPVLFTPPRDGRTLTHPTPIIGRSNNNSSSGTTITSSTSSSISTSSEVEVGCHDDDDDDDDDDNNDDDDVTDSGRSCNNENLLVGRYTTSTRALANGGDRDEENGGEVVIDL